MWTRIALVICLCAAAGEAAAADPALTASEEREGVLAIHDEGRLVMRYAYADEQILRPYFCDVHTPAGVQVTRNHPPAETDLQDHPTYHPGIWMAFGDLNGADCWRNKAPVEHVAFDDAPESAEGRLTFAVHNRYRDAMRDSVICDEHTRYTLSRVEGAYLLQIDSRFSAANEFSFGDQEEMGLGVRVATPLAEIRNAGGLLTDSRARSTAGAIWGQVSEWCDYSGVAGDAPVGVTILAHPENFRLPWWHVRDYGLLVANPFGRKAFTGGEPSRVTVTPGEELRLRFGVVIHDGRPGAGYDPRIWYARYSD